jgi:hypothetical protein
MRAFGLWLNDPVFHQRNMGGPLVGTGKIAMGSSKLLMI